VRHITYSCAAHVYRTAAVSKHASQHV
jgi:hypothetical protein